MSLPAVMLHLKVLEECGLVTSRKEGRVRTCRVEPQMLAQAEHWVSERRQMWERNLDRLGAYLDETKRRRRHEKTDFPDACVAGRLLRRAEGRDGLDQHERHHLRRCHRR